MLPSTVGASWGNLGLLCAFGCVVAICTFDTYRYHLAKPLDMSKLLVSVALGGLVGFTGRFGSYPNSAHLFDIEYFLSFIVFLDLDQNHRIGVFGSWVFHSED